MKTTKQISENIMRNIEQWFETTDTLGDRNTRDVLHKNGFTIIEQDEQHVVFKPMGSSGWSKDFEVIIYFNKNGDLIFDLRSYVNRVASFDGCACSQYSLDKKTGAKAAKVIDGWKERIGDLNKLFANSNIEKALAKAGLKLIDNYSGRILFEDEKGLNGEIGYYSTGPEVVGLFYRDELCAL